MRGKTANEIGHAGGGQDLVEALEASSAEALRIIPSAVVGKLVHPDQKARGTECALAEQRTAGGQERGDDLALVAKATELVGNLLGKAHGTGGHRALTRTAGGNEPLSKSGTCGSPASAEATKSRRAERAPSILCSPLRA